MRRRSIPGAGGCAPMIMIAVAIVTVFALLSGQALAQGMCGMRADMVATLKTKFQEGGIAGGIAGQVNLLEVFTSKAGTWTIMVTTPQGKSCIIAAGDGWQNYAPKPNEEET